MEEEFKGVTGDTKVLVKTATHGVESLTIKELSERKRKDKVNCVVFHDGSWSTCSQVKNYSENLYKVTTANKKTITLSGGTKVLTSNYILKRISELTSEDYILLNTSYVSEITEYSQKLTYNQGVLIGAYLGDGSRGKKKTCNSTAVCLSMNKNKVEELSPYLQPLCTWNTFDDKNNVVKMLTHDQSIFHFTHEWVQGNYSNTKRLNLNVLQQSYLFRKGILDGYYATDGGNRNRIYTTSEGLRDDMEVLLSSLGLLSVLDQDDRRGEIRQFRDEAPFTPNYIVHCIRWYNPKNKKVMKDLYKKVNGQMFFKINKIEKLDKQKELIYNFRITNKYENFFTLPNGIILQCYDKDFKQQKISK